MVEKKIYEKMREVNLGELSRVLDKAITTHNNQLQLGLREKLKPAYYAHSWEDFCGLVGDYTSNLPRDEETSTQLRQLLENKIELLLKNNCPRCVGLVDHIITGYHLEP